MQRVQLAQSMTHKHVVRVWDMTFFFIATSTCPLEKTFFAALDATEFKKKLHHLSWTDVHQKATIPNDTKNI